MQKNSPPPLHIVLFEPEIPPNTGNIARLCACTGCMLHLVHPLGFEISDKQLRRAGLDYWEWLDVKEYDDWSQLRENIQAEGAWYALSTKATDTIWDVTFKAGDVLVFGPESRGLPSHILDTLSSIKIPMRSDAPVRSLNLSSACSIVTYEALREINISIS
ncbi:MAG: tRNA (uridine(34)/cytosine(34)/5-carboxymethylaminomethyluridine(34)-2'-O)-methyltransferase TrmL [Proteobacteria bacterium]|nr:MAG: tRNA (uridine(34)/cytosine(34)/5-carboxymethylaminomethyluridine(34)-2'-O)-methyltransferase TrmL [Pseudomonadota bacterium]